MLRLDRSIHRAAPDAEHPMGPPVKPEGDGRRDAGDGANRIAPQKAASGATPSSAAPAPLPRPTVMLRLDRSIHGATPDARHPMGPPVKPEGDGRRDACDRAAPIAPPEAASGATPPSAARTPLPRTTVMLRLDRSIHGATPGAERPMGPPVKPEGDGRRDAGDGPDAIAPQEAASGATPPSAALTPLPRTTVMLRLDRSIHGATPDARHPMGPPVKPEGDGGWGAGDGGWVEGDNGWIARGGGWVEGDNGWIARGGGWVAGADLCRSEVSGGDISDMREAPPCAAFPAATIGAF